MFGIDLLEWIGYLASVLILVSLLMSSIVRLRWINLMGCFVFMAYGFLIGALPVGISNSVIALIDIYYLIRMYTAKEYFTILPISSDSAYLRYFLKLYHEDIRKYFPRECFTQDDSTIVFYIMRNSVPAGIFLASKKNEDSLLVELDYAVPEYRDFKTGRYIFKSQNQYFLDKGFDKIYSHAADKAHEKYLRKMGFSKTTEGDKEIFIKNLTDAS